MVASVGRLLHQRQAAVWSGSSSPVRITLVPSVDVAAEIRVVTQIVKTYCDNPLLTTQQDFQFIYDF